MAQNNQSAKTITIVAPQSITIVHSNPGIAPAVLTAGGISIPGSSIVHKNPA